MSDTEEAHVAGATRRAHRTTIARMTAVFDTVPILPLGSVARLLGATVGPPMLSQPQPASTGDRR